MPQGRACCSPKGRIQAAFLLLETFARGDCPPTMPSWTKENNNTGGGSAGYNGMLRNW